MVVESSFDNQLKSVHSPVRHILSQAGSAIKVSKISCKVTTN